MKKAIILSSGGVDSTTCVSLAVDRLGAENVVTASIFYGQKHKKEILAARKVAQYYHLKHYEFDLSQIFQYSNCSLLANSTEEIVHESYARQIAENGEGKVSTYVPFRNGLMLSTAASLAASLLKKMMWTFTSALMPTMQPAMPMQTAANPSCSIWEKPSALAPTAKCTWYFLLRK